MIQREKIRRFLIVALLSICTVLLVFVLFYDKTPSTVDVIEDVVMDADVELKTFHYTETVDGVAHWTLTGESAAHDFNQDQTRIDKVRMELFDQKNLGDVVLTADQGMALLSQEQVDVSGNVVIRTENGYTMKTDQATYFGNRSQGGMIESALEVDIRSGQLELHGTGLSMDIEGRRMQLKQAVSATFYPQVKKEQP
nr:LPS export ABC transporter periplasmic protein LptC [uncultured Desulfuromonas sp.]